MEVEDLEEPKRNARQEHALPAAQSSHLTVETRRIVADELHDGWLPGVFHGQWNHVLRCPEIVHVLWELKSRDSYIQGEGMEVEQRSPSCSSSGDHRIGGRLRRV